jgi:hypothetical protein
MKTLATTSDCHVHRPLAHCASFLGAPTLWNSRKHMQHEILKCNIRLKQIKHLKYTLATYVWKYMQHLDRNMQLAIWKRLLQHQIETDEIFWNILLQHMYKTICNVQIKMLATYVCKHMKQFEQTLATCLCNTCNILPPSLKNVVFVSQETLTKYV